MPDKMNNGLKMGAPDWNGDVSDARPALGRLGLGTVQWGLNYGLANEGGITPLETVAAILSEAREIGVTLLDTASLYGESERVLGSHPLEGFRVVTKTPRFATSTITGEQVSQLEQAVDRSLGRLSIKTLYGLLMHHAGDLVVPGGARLVDAMLALKERGVVEKIGVSIYDGDQLEQVLSIFKPDIIQLPVSVLDQRLLLQGWLAKLKDEGIEIHARSVFLQGLLLMPLGRVPAYFGPILPLLSRWHSAVEAQGMTPVQAALSFVRDLPYVDSVLVGVDNLSQFRLCCDWFVNSGRFDASGLMCHDARFVNPSQWKLA